MSLAEKIPPCTFDVAAAGRIQLGLPANTGNSGVQAMVMDSPADATSSKQKSNSGKNKRKSATEKGSKAKKLKQGTAEEHSGVSTSMSAFTFAAAACSVHAEKKPVPQDKKWWGCNYFVSAGYLTGLEPADEARKRQTFCEDDQEKLYHQTQDKKAAGRQGIGVRGSAIKIAGGKYEGTKVKFDDDDAQAPSPARADAEQLASVKWKKLIATQLKKAPDGAMKVKKLQKQVATEALAKIGMAVCVEHLKEVVMQKLTSSSRFVVDGKLARCC